MEMDITAVQKGDIVRFKSYSLRVEEEPVRGKGTIRLNGRVDVGGSPMVSKLFIKGKLVEVERETL